MSVNYTTGPCTRQHPVVAGCPICRAEDARLACGHPVGCLEDDQCGRPEHRYCGWCRALEDCREAEEKGKP